jgi:hypothetical protein
MAAATLTFPSQTLLKNVVDPVDGTDAATKTYVDGKTGAGSVAAAGSNTQIQYNSSNSIGASSALTFDYAGNILTITGNIITTNANLGNIAYANFYTGDGGLLSNIKSAGGISNTVSASSQPNITSVGNLVNLTIGNTIPNVYINGSGNAIIGGDLSVLGNANLITLLVGNTASNVYINNAGDISAGGNVSINGNLTVLGTMTTVNNETIQQSETVTGNLDVSGLSNLANVIITSLEPTRIPFANANHALVDSSNLTFNSTSNTLSATLFTGTLTTANQPNITSVGTLTKLDVSNQANTVTLLVGNTASNVKIDNTGNINAAGNITIGDGTGGSITGANSVTANYFIGNGSLLTAITGANITGTVANANYSAYAGNVTLASQPTITSLGTLTSLTVSGDISGQSNLTVSNNLTSTKLTVTGNSILQGNVEIQKNVSITSATDSTNSSTGALILTLGGLGVYGNIHSGMDVSGLTLTGNITTANQSNITTVGTLTGLVMAGDITGSGASPAPSLSGFSSVSAINLTGNINTANQPNITSVGTLTSLAVTGNITNGNITGGNLVSASFFTGTLTTASQPNITSLGTLVNVTVSGTSNLGNVGNITITGGTSGQYLKTDGTGNINWATIDSSKLANGNSEIDILNNGNIDFTVAGVANTVVFATDGSVVLGSGSGGNIDGANVVNANTVAASNAITRNGRTVATYVSSTTMPTNPQVGDEWYDQTLHKIYQYIYDGSAYNWIDVSAGYIVANVQAQGGTLAVRDSNGNIYANTFSGNSLSINNLSITGTTSIGSMVSSGNGKPVSNSIDTLIDTFPKTLYRSAKYIISARNDDGFEVAEILTIHDDSVSFIQTYGDVSTGIVQDIVTFSSNIVAGNVCLYATGSNSNTFVNLVSTYVTD